MPQNEQDGRAYSQIDIANDVRPSDRLSALRPTEADPDRQNVTVPVSRVVAFVLNALGSGMPSGDLPQYIINALLAANGPDEDNAFATLLDTQQTVSMTWPAFQALYADQPALGLAGRSGKLLVLSGTPAGGTVYMEIIGGYPAFADAYHLTQTVDSELFEEVMFDPIAGTVSERGGGAIDETNLVHRTGAESIDGRKDFIQSPNVPEPEAANSAANRQYVDDSRNTAVTLANAYTDQQSQSVRRLAGTSAGYDASTNPGYPSTAGTGLGGAIRRGDSFYVGVAGTVAGIAVEVGDQLEALVANPGQVAANWRIPQGNLFQATESTAGTGKIVTQATIQTETTTNNTDLLTAVKFWLGFARARAVAWTWSALQTFNSLKIGATGATATSSRDFNFIRGNTTMTNAVEAATGTAAWGNTSGQYGRMKPDYITANPAVAAGATVGGVTYPAPQVGDFFYGRTTDYLYTWIFNTDGAGTWAATPLNHN